MTGLDGMAVVVTGAAGGVGQAVSTWLAAEGARVFNLDRREPATASGEFVGVDVLDPVSIDAAVSYVLVVGADTDRVVPAATVEPCPTVRVVVSIIPVKASVALR